MNIGSLTDALADVGKTPCEKYTCEKRAQCSSEEMACTAFQYFVISGKSLNPFLDVPSKITKKDQPVFRDTIRPTAKIFQLLQTL